MIISIYEELKELQEPQEIKERLIAIDHWDMFSPIEDAYPQNWSKIIQWIIQCFSIQSDFISVDEDFEKTRRKIAAKLNIDDENIILLKIPSTDKKPKKKKSADSNEDDTTEEEQSLENTVNKVLFSYLELQGEREFKHLMILRLTYEKQLNSVYEVDWDQQMKNLENANKIYEQIKEYEQRISEKLGHQLYDHYKSVGRKLGKNLLVHVEGSKLIQE